MTNKEKSGPSLMAKIRNAGLHIVRTVSGETVTKKLYDKEGSLIADPSGTAAAIGAVDAHVDAVEEEIGDREAPVAGTVRADIAELGRRIEAITITGRYLSGWNCVTGQPDTQPTALPYVYPTGGFYIVSNVSSEGPNYMPEGASYTGAASTVAAPEGTKIYDIFKYDGSAWSKIPTSGIVVSFGSIAGDPMDNLALATAFSAKADDNSVVKLTGDQSINGIKYFKFPATAQWIKTATIPTGKFIKVMEMQKPTEEIDLDILARTYWGKMALVHIRAYPQASETPSIINTLKFEIRFSTGQICLAHNTITSKYELWTSETQCAFSLVDSFSRSRAVQVASMVATPAETPADKPAVGEVYEWVLDLQSI